MRVTPVKHLSANFSSAVKNTVRKSLFKKTAPIRASPMPKNLNEGRKTVLAEKARSRRSHHSRMDQLVVEDHCSADMSSVERIES